MWQVLTGGLLFLAGGIAGFYLGWAARADEDLCREDGPAAVSDSQRYRVDD